MREGELDVGNDGALIVRYTSRNGNEVRCAVERDTLDQRLEVADWHAVRGTRVRFQHAPNAQAARGVDPGDDWQPPAPRARPPSAPTDRQRNRGVFHNPYNFVPAPPRVTGGALGDAKPAGHDRFLDDLWSGTLTLRFETATPLLLVDADGAEESGDRHWTYGIREREEGVPEVPVTSLKGTLRAAYEAVTNSRFGVFDDHETPRAYRQTTNVAPTMVPARVLDASDDNFRVQLLPGTTGVVAEGLTIHDRQYAAWLPWHGNPNMRPHREPPDHRPGHGEAVRVQLRAAAGRGNNPVQRWQVESLSPVGQDEPVPAIHEQNNDRVTATGWVYWTNNNINGKHDERVFFAAQNAPKASAPATAKIASRYRWLVADYRAAHEGEDLTRRDARNDPAGAEWSRHLLQNVRAELRTGDLCYVTVAAEGQGWRVTGAYPVMIGRELFEAAPAELVDDSLKPATDLWDLSPADRVFGWTHPRKHGSYRGQVRIEPVRCQTDDAIERFDGNGLPLAILAQPKPQQARFYAAKDAFGSPLEESVPKGEGYRRDQGQGLRGRKVYPHHAGLPGGYWHQPTSSHRVGNRYREYRRDGDTRDTQNRTVTAWVKPGVWFEATIRVSNLSDVELGALLWLLDLPSDCHHRLGGGKPLGFGSVRTQVAWEQTSLWRGAAAREAYRDFRGLEGVQPEEDPHRCVASFKEAVHQDYGTPDDEAGEGAKGLAPFVDAWLAAARGFQQPVHYPRPGQPGNDGVIPPDPESYRWFVANERIGRHPGPGAPLLRLQDDPGLPALG
jgi:CRISPR-associated protein (TIGR03986 family)